MNRLLPAFALSFLVLTSFQKKQPFSEADLQGVVTDSETGKPLENVYLYVREGIEEDLTNKKGEFKIKTWQELPVILTIQHASYKQQQHKIVTSSRSITLKLKRK